MLSALLSNIILAPFVMTEEQEYTLPQEAFQLRHEIMDNPSAPEHLQQDKADSPHVSGNEAEVTCLTPIESFSLISISQPLFNPHLPASFFCPIVREMLSYYAEQGDVQMAVSVLIVLGDRIRKEIDDLTQVRWGGVSVVKTALKYSSLCCICTISLKFFLLAETLIKKLGLFCWKKLIMLKLQLCIDKFIGYHSCGLKKPRFEDTVGLTHDPKLQIAYLFKN